MKKELEAAVNQPNASHNEENSSGAPKKKGAKKLTKGSYVGFTLEEYEALIEEYDKSAFTSFSGLLRSKILKKTDNRD